MKLYKWFALIFIVLSSIFVVTGCWSYREVEELGLVSGIAIDRSEDKQRYLITVEFAEPSTAGQQVKISSQIYSAEGSTIFDAVRELIQISGKRVYWSHTKVIIIGEDLAKEGVVKALDWFARDYQPRPNMSVLVSEKISAGQLLRTKLKSLEINSAFLDRIVRAYTSNYKFRRVTYEQFTSNLEKKTISATAPKVTTEVKQNNVNMRVGGEAVFKGDKLVGWLTEDEALDMSILMGEAKDGLITLKNALDTNTDVTLQIFNAYRKVTPINKDGNLTMNVDINLETIMDEVGGTTDFITEGERNKLVKEEEDFIKHRLEKLIYKTQKEYKADILGFGGITQKKLPGYWKEKVKDPIDEYSKLSVKVNVKVGLRGSGKRVKPFKIGG